MEASRLQSLLPEPRADLNQLQTQLCAAVAAEDYAKAAELKKVISDAQGADAPPPRSWGDLNIPHWLVDRAERLGYMFPNAVQQQAAQSLMLGADAVIRSETGSGKTLAFLLPALSMLEYPPITYPDDLEGPQAVIVVPHRELGVQLALLIYRFFGGSVNGGIPGERANMFTYEGPRGIVVKGCLDKEEVLRAKNAGYLRGAHVVVGTPECLAECLIDPESVAVMQHTKVVVVDEADECCREHGEPLDRILAAACSQEERPTMAFAGATVDDALYEELVAKGWLSYPSKVESAAHGGLPPGLKHRFVVVPPGMPATAVMTRLLREDLKARGADNPPPRVMAFVEDAAAADAIANPLRNALWEEHRIGLVLPDGMEPTKTLQDFRDSKTSMILLTAALARGLDLPSVSHVYNVGAPKSATEYVHRAGRAGRVGAGVSGQITTIVTPAEVEGLREIAGVLGVAAEAADVGVATGGGVGGVTLTLPGDSADEGAGAGAHTGEQDTDTSSGSEIDDESLTRAKKALEDILHLY